MHRILAILLALTAPAAAAGSWSVTSHKDQMTDQIVAVARLAPANGAGTLHVQCVNGAVFPEIIYNRRIGFGSIGAVWRFDQGQIHSIIATLDPTGSRVWLFIGAPDPIPGVLRQMRKAKRLRVQIGSDFMDFSLIGADEALAQVKCER